MNPMDLALYAEPGMTLGRRWDQLPPAKPQHLPVPGDACRHRSWTEHFAERSGVRREATNRDRARRKAKRKQAKAARRRNRI